MTAIVVATPPHQNPGRHRKKYDDIIEYRPASGTIRSASFKHAKGSVFNLENGYIA